MSDTLRIRLTPTEKAQIDIVGFVDVDREDDLLGILRAGGYLKVTRDNGDVQWVNLDHILAVETEKEPVRPQVHFI